MPRHLPQEMRRLLRRWGCKCGGCASLKEMIHLQWETIASPERDAVSPAGDAVSPEEDLLASSDFWICDTTQSKRKILKIEPMKM